MPDRRFAWTLLVIAVACLSLPRPAEAQLRGPSGAGGRHTKH